MTDVELAPAKPLLRGWLHLLALLVAIPAGPILVARATSAGARASVIVYAVALVGLYGISSSYHLLRWSPAGRARMRRMDHAMIYVFIAACYTPVCLLVVRGKLGWTMLILGWIAGATGVATTMSRFAHGRVAVGGYLVTGWLLVIGLTRVVTRLDGGQLAFLAIGGIAYTLGFVVLTTHWPDPSPRAFGYHETWHAMVVAGSVCHYLLFWSIVRGV
jgi:hemolysin III